MNGLNADDLFSGWHWGKGHWAVHCGGDDGWRWAEGKERGFKDPTCGSDLTLHAVQSHQEQVARHFYSPFAGVPITNRALPVGDVDPWLAGWGRLGNPSKPDEKQVFRSPFAGSVIRNGPLPVGDVDPWLLPHKHRQRPSNPSPRWWGSPFAGIPISGRRGGREVGAIVPMPAPAPPPRKGQPFRWSRKGKPFRWSRYASVPNILRIF